MFQQKRNVKCPHGFVENTSVEGLDFYLLIPFVCDRNQHGLMDQVSAD